MDLVSGLKMLHLSTYYAMSELIEIKQNINNEII